MLGLSSVATNFADAQRAAEINDTWSARSEAFGDDLRAAIEALRLHGASALEAEGFVEDPVGGVRWAVPEQVRAELRAVAGKVPGAQAGPAAAFSLLRLLECAEGCGRDDGVTIGMETLRVVTQQCIKKWLMWTSTQSADSLHSLLARFYSKSGRGRIELKQKTRVLLSQHPDTVERHIFSSAVRVVRRCMKLWPDSTPSDAVHTAFLEDLRSFYHTAIKSMVERPNDECRYFRASAEIQIGLVELFVTDECVCRTLVPWVHTEWFRRLRGADLCRELRSYAAAYDQRTTRAVALLSAAPCTTVDMLHTGAACCATCGSPLVEVERSLRAADEQSDFAQACLHCRGSVASGPSGSRG
jgi:hypothetical protein